MDLFSLPVEILLEIASDLDLKSLLRFISVSKMGKYIGDEVLSEKFRSLNPLIRSKFNTSVSSPNGSCIMTPTATSCNRLLELDLDAVNSKLESHKASSKVIDNLTTDNRDHTILKFNQKEMDLRVHEDESKFTINVNCQFEGEQVVQTRWRAPSLPIGETSNVRVPMEFNKMGFFEFSITNLGEPSMQFGCYDYDAVYRYKLILNTVFIDKHLMLTLAERGL